MKNKYIISIEGNIGSGKTTIIENLKKRFENDASVIFLTEPVDIWEKIKDKDGKTILSKFYEDPEKYAFPFQVMAYATRTEKISNAKKENPDAKFIICERSLEADNNIFAKMLKDDNKIEDINYQIYEHFYKSRKEENNVDAVVYIDASPSKCLERIQKRSRTGEAGISYEYLQTCRDYHDKWLIDGDEFPVLRINTNEDVKYDMNDPDEMGNVWIKNISSFIKTLPNSCDKNKELFIAEPKECKVE